MVCHVGLAVLSGARSRVGDRAKRLLATYAALTAVWSAFFALRQSIPSATTLAFVSERIVSAGPIALAVVLLSLIYDHLDQARLVPAWWVAGLGATLVVTLLHPDVLPLPLSTFQIGGRVIGQAEMAHWLGMLVWTTLTATACIAVIYAYRQTTGLMRVNRLRYLLLFLSLLIAGDIALATANASIRLFGALIKLGSVLVLSLAILRHHLVDIKTLYRRAFSYIAVTLATAAIGLTGIWFSSLIVGGQGFQSALISIGLVSVLVSFGVVPLRDVVQRFVDRKLFYIQVDYETALRAYGERIAGMLALEPLSDLVIGTLVATTGARHVGLYLAREGESDAGGLLLHPLKRYGDLPITRIELAANSALTRCLNQSNEPQIPYEISQRRDAGAISGKERAWLQSLKAEVLVPVHNPDKLVGLISVGGRRSRESYSPSDLAWFKALADQTAVALENARLFGQVQDMSASVMRLNADLKRAVEQLQEVDRLKSAFIGLISHELRSPFVAAGFSVQLLYRYLQEGMIEELHAQIEQLDRELAEGRRMIDNVISFASLLSRRGELHPEETDLGELIQTTLAPLRQLAQARHVVLSLQVSPELEPARVDKGRLGEAIYHLAHNAIKFNHKGGKAHVSCWATETDIVLKVEDTGTGIPSEKLPLIWEAFTQAADDVRRGVEGLGLGLALVKFVVDAHGGEVWASSQPGTGSTFGFRIPYQIGKQPEAQGRRENGNPIRENLDPIRAPGGRR